MAGRERLSCSSSLTISNPCKIKNQSLIRFFFLFISVLHSALTLLPPLSSSLSSYGSSLSPSLSLLRHYLLLPFQLLRLPGEEETPLMQRRAGDRRRKASIHDALKLRNSDFLAKLRIRHYHQRLPSQVKPEPQKFNRLVTYHIRSE